MPSLLKLKDYKGTIGWYPLYNLKTVKMLFTIRFVNHKGIIYNYNSFRVSSKEIGVNLDKSPILARSNIIT